MNVISVFSKGCSACVQGGAKAMSGAGAEEPGERSRPNRRDILESSAEGKFYNYYSSYEGLADPGGLGDRLRYRCSHTIGYTSAWFFEASGEALQKAKGEKDNYDGTDVVNAYGFAYARRYEEIEKRYENSQEQWFDIDGTPLTKEKEMEYLNTAYEAAAAFQVSSAKVMAGLRQMPEVSQKDMEGLENIFYRSRDKYTELCKESMITGEPMTFQRLSFGKSALLALLV